MEILFIIVFFIRHLNNLIRRHADSTDWQIALEFFIVGQPQTLSPGIDPLLFMCYDPNGEVRPDIFAQLEAYRCYSNVAFVSASPLLIDNTNSMEKLRDICDIVLAV